MIIRVVTKLTMFFLEITVLNDSDGNSDYIYCISTKKSFYNFRKLIQYLHDIIQI